jgi:hypothetical protein
MMTAMASRKGTHFSRFTLVDAASFPAHLVLDAASIATRYFAVNIISFKKEYNRAGPREPKPTRGDRSGVDYSF